MHPHPTSSPCPREGSHSYAISRKFFQGPSCQGFITLGLHMHRRADAAQTARGESWTSGRSAYTSGCRSSWAARTTLRSWRAMGMCSSSRTLATPFRACYRAELAYCEQRLALGASSTPWTSWRPRGRGTGPVREDVHGLWLESLSYLPSPASGHCVAQQFCPWLCRRLYIFVWSGCRS